MMIPKKEFSMRYSFVFIYSDCVCKENAEIQNYHFMRFIALQMDGYSFHTNNVDQVIYHYE